eukprot:89700-Chlamydomonas_euryale.AAC.1
MRQGDAVDSMFVVESGAFDSFVAKDGGGAARFGRSYAPGDVLGVEVWEGKLARVCGERGAARFGCSQAPGGALGVEVWERKFRRLRKGEGAAHFGCSRTACGGAAAAAQRV